MLGDCYRCGLKGLAKSPELGAEWTAKAACAGFAYSQKMLGLLHSKGEGVPQEI